MTEASKSAEAEQRLEAEYMAWFQRLQALTSRPLDPDDWVERWFDNYPPADALAAGPEAEEDDEDDAY